MYAGKKLRKWYGQEGQVLPRDGGSSREDSEDTPVETEEAAIGPREYVFVMDADSSPMAEQVLLQLILARAKIKALFKDVQSAKLGFGPYVEVIGENGFQEGTTVPSAFQSVDTLLLCGPVTQSLVAAAAAAGVNHIVLLSAVRAPSRGGFFLLRSTEMTVLEDVGREDAVINSGITHTIVRVGGLSDGEGGISVLDIVAQQPPSGSVSREDAANALMQAAVRDAGTGSLTFSISSGGPGRPPEDWGIIFSRMLPVSTR